MKARTSRLSRMGQIFVHGRRIDEALRTAAREAVRRHELHDVPVVVWRDGHIAWVPARELSAKTPKRTAGKTRAVSRRR
jgi:hypothetical protein